MKTIGLCIKLQVESDHSVLDI